MSRYPLVLSLLVLALLHGCGESPVESETEPAPAPSPVRVEVLADQIQPVLRDAPASVLAANESQLSAEVAAPVLRVHADVGARVAAGELMLELDATDLRLIQVQAQARVGAAQARVAQSRQRLERSRALRERDFVSADEIDALETEMEALAADVAVAQADLRVAARNVEKARLRAPFEGVVVERQAQVGVLASIGMPLLRLVDLSAAEVEAALQVAEAERLDQARALMFESQGRHYPVQVLRLAGVVDPAARTQVVRLGFVGAPAPAGSSGTLRWEIPARQLPPQLLVRRGEALGLFVVDEGLVRFVPVTGASEGRPFEVDLPASTYVVVEGQQGLNDGDRIDDGSVSGGQ